MADALAPSPYVLCEVPTRLTPEPEREATVKEFVTAWETLTAQRGTTGLSTPLMADDIAAWATGEHPHVDWVRLFVLRDTTGAVAARFCVHASSELDARLREATVIAPSGHGLYFGALEYRDAEALQAALSEVRAIGQALGASTLFGPVSLLPNQVGGALTAGFEHPGFFDTAYNCALLPEVLTEQGFLTWYPSATWEVPVSTIGTQRRAPVTEEEWKAAGVRPVKVSRFDLRAGSKFVDKMRRALNASFAQLPYFTQISGAQMRLQTEGLSLLADPDLVVATTHGDDALASFALVVPDPVATLRTTDGRLRLRDLPSLARDRLRRRGSFTDAVLIVQGTDPAMQGRGLLSLVTRQVFAALHRRGYQRLRVTFIGEDNPASAAVFEKAGGYRLHQVGFFYLPLPTEKPTELVRAADVQDWVEVAGRSPSAHNAQPWDPQIAPDGSALRLRVHSDRMLKIGDPTHRDLYLSLGCWVESLDHAAASQGFGVELNRVTGLGADLEVQIGFAPRLKSPLASVDDVLNRRVHRGEFTRDWEALVAAAERAGLPGLETDAPDSGLGVDIVPAHADAWEATAARHLLCSPQMVQELLRWLRLDAGHPDYHRDGLNAACLRLPGGVSVAGRALRSPIGQRLKAPLTRVVSQLSPGADERSLERNTRAAWRRTMHPQLSRRMLSQLSERFRGIPLGASRGAARLVEVPDDGRGLPVVFYSTAPAGSDPTPEDARPAALIDAGRALQRFWLQLHRRGLSVHPVSEVIDAPVTQQQLTETLTGMLTATDEDGEPTGESPTVTPLAYFRVGIPTDVPPRSARLTSR